jgi:hypothetical protein
VNGVIKILTLIFVVAAFFGVLLHPAAIGSTTTGLTSVVKQVQAG